MPAQTPQLTVADAEREIRRRSFGAAGADAVGIELEWLTFDSERPTRRLAAAELDAVMAAARLPHGGRLTMEPGGQLELSTPPRATASAACEAALDDLFALDRTCAAAGIDLIALGADPVRPPARITDAARYEAMDTYFASVGGTGLQMMANTASVQVNVGLGADPAQRWERCHALGPVLSAAFANSPVWQGRPTGWASTRLLAWWTLDPTRAAPAPSSGLDPARAWARYCLDANVMMIRRGPDDCAPLAGAFPFGRWIAEGHELGWPTLDDLHYHLSTLFPPVRPRGWIELRMLDALPTPYWYVAVALICALLDDDEAGALAARACEPVRGAWVTAARDGMRHPGLAAAADTVFGLAREVLEGSRSDDATAAIVADYHRRFVRRRRTPADERLDDYGRTGRLLPVRESPVPYALLEAAWR